MAGAGALAWAAWAWSVRSSASSPDRRQPETPFPSRLPPEALSPADITREAPQIGGGYRRDVERPKPVQNVAETLPAATEAAVDPSTGGPANRRRDEKKTLPEIFRMPSDPRPAPQPAPAAQEGGARPDPPPPIRDDFAPYGRLVKCQLVETLDSVTSRSEPIIGLVTEDLSWNGTVIIPAGTEVFGYARPEAVMDQTGVGRLVDNGEWTLVLPRGEDGDNGRELALKGRAMDRREALVGEKGGVRSWGLDDGADGLVGYTLSTLDNREIRLFAAAALGGIAQGFAPIVERRESVPGVAGALGATQAAPTLGNALAGSVGAGATEFMNQAVARIRGEIERRGVYVRVPAGKEFYLFVEQTIDPRAAAIGLRLPPGMRPPG